jgi:hypothetical protein
MTSFPSLPIGEEFPGEVARERHSPEWRRAKRPPRRGDWRSRAGPRD